MCSFGTYLIYDLYCVLFLKRSSYKNFQQLNADLISSSKESESDMFDQRNQCFQTVILSATIMFSSLVTVIFQGFLASTASSFIYISYSLTSALSFAFLFLSIVLCVEVLLRASSFMYNRATTHTTQLREAIQKTKMMMKKIRVGEQPVRRGSVKGNNQSNYKTHEDENKKRSHDDGHENRDNNVGGEKSQNGVESVESSKRNLKGNRQIADMEEKDLQVEWAKHEAEVHQYLEERERINDQTSVLVSADANSSRMSFEQFWRESCKLWGDIAILFFYAGTANLLLAIMIYMWSEFFINYHNIVAAIIAVLVIGVSIVVGTALYFFLRQNNHYRNRQAKAGARTARNDAEYDEQNEYDHEYEGNIDDDDSQ
jgi:predicted membrane protein